MASAQDLRVIDAPRGAAVPATPRALLETLGSPALLRAAGRDRSRTRAVATLLHGNEPSGLHAVHAWLRSGAVPAVDALLFVASVRTALAGPGFAHRMLPGRRDLNRCFFPPFSGEEGALAEEVLKRLRDATPEALIDLHNNTGHNPAYGVGPRAGTLELNLAGLFGERFVHSSLRLGALVEATADAFPSVTIECGRAGDPAADAVALRGLERYLAVEELEAGRLVAQPMSLLVDPVRVCVRAPVRLAFGERPEPEADLTVARDVDRHNFELLPAGARIGWVDGGAAWPLDARTAGGAEVSREYFEIRDGALCTRRRLVPIMMTTNPAVARSDCLFYAVRPAERAHVPTAQPGGPPA